MVELVSTSEDKQRTVKPRVGVILRQVGGQKSANLNTELEELKERYKLMLPQFKKLEKALKRRHATMLKTEEARVGVANVLAEMSKDTPLAEAAGKPTERSTADKAYANAVDEWTKTNKRQCDKYKSFALDYVAEWESTVTTRVNADISATTQLRRDADHYMVKVDSLEKSIQKLKDKGKPVPEATTEKLARNREKLDEANVAYNRAAKNLFLLLEEVVDRSWHDLHPLMLKLMKFDLSVHAEEEQVLRTVGACVAYLQYVSQEHGIGQEPRLASLVGTYTNSDDKNTNNAKESTNAKVDSDQIPSTGGGGGAGGGAAKDNQDNKNDAKDDNKNKNDAPEDNYASKDNPGSGISCSALKSGCYFPTMCCSEVCSFGMTTSSIGMCQ